MSDLSPGQEQEIVRFTIKELLSSYQNQILQRLDGVDTKLSTLQDRLNKIESTQFQVANFQREFDEDFKDMKLTIREHSKSLIQLDAVANYKRTAMAGLVFGVLGVLGSLAQFASHIRIN